MNSTSQRVLLTGASGFIAAWVLKELLQSGYTVRATVRSTEKQTAIAKKYPDAVSSGKLTFAIVEDISVPGAHDAAVAPFEGGEGLDFVVHTASPFHMHAEDPKKDMLDPAVEGTRGLLTSIHKHAPTVKRVAVTSSFAAIEDSSKAAPPASTGVVYSEKDWNPITWEQAATKGESASNYTGSKKFAEKAAWDFVAEHKPAFELVTFCPPYVFGPVINEQSTSDLNTSSSIIWGFLTGDLDEPGKTETPAYVDVRDLAKAHVAGLSAPGAGGQRFFIVAEDHLSKQGVCDLLRERFPDLRDRIPEGKPGSGLGYPTRDAYQWDNSKSKKILGLKYHSFEDTIIDTAKALLELSKQS